MTETARNGGAASVARCRNRYFTGKLMTAADFANDPSYLVDRHRLHNRLLHGWGIVDGLEVVPHPNPECRDRWVKVEPGIALDGQGREIVLAEPAAVEVVPAGTAAPPEGPFAVLVAYGEEEIEPVPALYVEGLADPGHREANRLREVPRFLVVRVADLAPGEWPVDGTSHDRVALAAVSRPAAYAASKDLVIDSGGRRRLRPVLTGVAFTCWPHGGTIALRDLRERLRARLEVRFTRPLRPPTSGGTGISPWTFRVAASPGPTALPEPVPGEIETAAGGSAAVFCIAPDALDALAGKTLSVTLHCDFLLDAEGKAVDGGHLGGRLPGGRGAPGGLFESWFHIAAASEEESHGGE